MRREKFHVGVLLPTRRGADEDVETGRRRVCSHGGRGACVLALWMKTWSLCARHCGADAESVCSTLRIKTWSVCVLDTQDADVERVCPQGGRERGACVLDTAEQMRRVCARHCG